MKRTVCIVLLLCTLIGMTGCSQKQDHTAPISFYYLRTPLPDGEIIHGAADSVIAAETRESAGYESDYTHLIEMYLQGALDDQFRSPYPPGTLLVDFRLVNETVTVTLTDHFAKLTGMDLSLACGCLTMTVLEMTGATQITIFTEGALLDGKESLTFTRDSFVLFDDAVPEIA